MKGIINVIPEKYRNLFTLVFGNSISAFLPILISPILTRLFTENDFGELTLFISVIIIITSFSTGRYHMGILEAENESDSSKLAILSILISLLIGSVTALLIWLLKSSHISLQIIDDLGWAIYLLPATIVFISIFQVTQSVLNRAKDYSAISTVKIVKSGGISIIQLVTGLVSFTPYGLVIGKALGELIGSFYSIIDVLRKSFVQIKDLSVNQLLHVGRKYKKYIAANSPHSLITAISGNVTPLILAVYFSSEIVGYYGLSIRVSVLPVMLISHAFFQLFSREIVLKIEQEADPYQYFKESTMQIIKIGIVPFLILLLFGPELFKLVFGENWELSGKFSQILTPYLFTTFIVSPFTFVPVLRNYHYHALIIEIVSMILKITMLLIGAQFFDAITTIWLFSGISTFVNIALYIWIRSLLLKVKPSKV